MILFPLVLAPANLNFVSEKSDVKGEYKRMCVYIETRVLSAHWLELNKDHSTMLTTHALDNRCLRTAPKLTGQSCDIIGEFAK